MGVMNLSSLTFEISPERRSKAEEYKQFLLTEVDEINQFKEQHGLSDDFMKANISTLNQFYRTLKANKTRPELYVMNNALYYTEYPLSADEQRRLISGKFKRLITDENTQAFSGASVHNISPDLGQREALEFGAKYLKEFSFASKQTGAWLCGDKGIGKSYFLGGVANELVKRNAEVIYISASTLVNDMLNTVKADSKKFSKKMDEYKKAEIMMLDDMGTELLTKWTVQSVIYEILNARMNNKLKTWFTSNLTKQEYQIHVTNSIGDKMTAERLMTRIDTLAAEIQMSGKNLRKVAKA